MYNIVMRANGQDLLKLISASLQGVEKTAAVTRPMRSLESPNSTLQRSLSGTSGNIRQMAGTTGSIRQMRGMSGSMRSLAGTTGNIRQMSGTSGNIRQMSGTAGNIRQMAGTAGNIRAMRGVSGSIRKLAGDQRDVRICERKAAEVPDGGSAVSLADSTTAYKLPHVDYVPADRGILFDTPRRGPAEKLTAGQETPDAYRILPTSGVDFGGDNRVSVDVHAYGRKLPYNEMQRAATVANYYTRLLNNPEFVKRLGGPAAAKRVARMMSASKVYENGSDWRSRGEGVYNPITGSIGIGGGLFDPAVATHENGHRMYAFSKAYRSRFRDIMERNGVEYSPLYIPPALSRSNTVEGNRSTYLNQPNEQAAEFQAIRMQSGAFPGTGSGKGGAFVPADMERVRPYMKQSPFFNDKDDKYMLDLLNNAKNRAGAVRYRPTVGMA